jgi:DNA repair photolyase
LHRSPLAGQDNVLSLNLAVGCGHRCGFCSARAYPSYPGDHVVYLYGDTVERISRELAERAQPPRAVYVSPSTDPFPPLVEVQQETARVVSLLARRDIEVWLMTRGYIRPVALEVLSAHRQQVKVTVGLTTIDRALQRTLEPFAASPRLRLRQIRQLRNLGIAVQVALEPLIPGVTDTRDNLSAMLRAVAAVGIRQVSAGYMFLRPRIQENLCRTLEPLGYNEGVQDAFRGGPILEAGPVAAAQYLPKARRQRGYAALMALAAEVGITVRVSGMTNPDFRAPPPAQPTAADPQRMLPPFEETFCQGRRLQPTEEEMVSGTF